MNKEEDENNYREKIDPPKDLDIMNSEEVVKSILQRAGIVYCKGD